MTDETRHSPAETVSHATCDCPRCDGILQKKALADSDQRIHAIWLFCEACGWDQRSTKQLTAYHRPEGT